MSSQEGNYPQNQEEIILTREEDKVNFTLLPTTTIIVKDEENDEKYDPSELSNVVEASFPLHAIKVEPEDLQYDFQPQPENATLKEEPDVEEHKSGWALTGKSTAGIFKHESDKCDSVQENELQSSESKTEGKAVYNCPYCHYKTIKKSNYIRHYNSKHEQCPEMYNSYKCEECSYETRHKSNLINHYKCKHAEDAKVYKCHECSYETKNKCHFTGHYKNKHSKEVEVHKCRECSYETKYKSALTQHYKRKHSTEAEVYKCKECSFETRYKGALIQHYRRMHQK